MLVFKLFFIPIMIFISGGIIEGYDYKYYDNHSKYFSHNGINLTFIKFSHNQWEYFLKKLSKKYHHRFAIVALVFNIIIDFLILPNKETMWYKFTFYIIGELFIFLLMIYKTRKNIK